MKYALITLGVVVLLAAAFWGGTLFAGGQAAGPGGPGGGFAELSASERQELQSMSDEERQAFFEDKGIDMPAGGPGGMPGADGATAGRRGGPGTLEGTVAAISGEEVTVALTGGGSTVVYVDADTVKAVAEGSTGTLSEGAEVLVFAEPEADGVMTARAIVVK